jgi:hypothetical protein
VGGKGGGPFYAHMNNKTIKKNPIIIIIKKKSACLVSMRP